MASLRLLLAVVCSVFSLLSCTAPPPPPNPTPPGESVFRAAARRLTAVVVSSDPNVDSWVGENFSRTRAPRDADGGSAAPITADGYFLTADHVLASAEGRNIHIIYGQRGRPGSARARLVWRSGSNDLALVHAPISTPDFYRWTPGQEWLPVGTPVMHAGIATGFDSQSGKLVSSLRPERGLSGAQRFKHDIPLEPGDSGGPVVDARGLLVGVNSAVEFLVPLETAFFIESEANRPNVRDLMEVIRRDRESRGVTEFTRQPR